MNGNKFLKDLAVIVENIDAPVVLCVGISEKAITIANTTYLNLNQQSKNNIHSGLTLSLAKTIDITRPS